ncbi:iron transport regulator [Pseudonocardia sp. TMWB2A]|uniref:FecR family protein n=1 Tax=Pseudonocardia sp. TMWB2A TaxID=687430 RepID=UPI00307FA44D
MVSGHGQERAHERYSRQASNWFVLLEDDPDNAEVRAAFNAWIAADTDHLLAWNETVRISRLINAAGESGQQDETVIPFNRLPIYQRRKPGWAFGASIAATILLLWLAGPELVLRVRSDQVTSAGEVRAMTLADGSKVHLAPQSAIAFNIDGPVRSVSLLRGAAFFDVAHDAARPFKVRAGSSETTVLGTAFEVGLEDDDATIAVRRGMVGVSDRDRSSPHSEKLRPGESVQLTGAGKFLRKDIRVNHVAAWVDKKLIVNDRPITDVLNALRPWYKGRIIVRHATRQPYHVTGVYNLDDPDAALAALSSAHALDVQHVSPWLRIVTIR